MTATRRATILLWSTALACVGGSALVVASFWIWPITAPTVPDVSQAPHRSNSTADPSLPSLADFEPALALNLRAPLVEPVAPAPVASTPAPLSQVPVPSNLTLVGTVVEPGHSFGIFQVGLAAVEVRGVGQKTSTGAEVVEVTAKGAKVKQDGRVMPLALADATKASSMGSLNNLLAQIAERRAQIRANGGIAPQLPEIPEKDDPEADEPEEPVEIVQPNLIGNEPKDFD